MFDIEEFLPYLVNRAGVRMAQNFEKELAVFSAALNEWRVLAALHGQPQPRMSELAALTSIDRTTLSRIIARMDSAGLVSRSRDAEDAREVRVHATDKGSSMVAAILPIAQRYETIALAGFDEAEARSFRSMLRRMYANLEQV